MNKFRKEFEFKLSNPITYQHELGEKTTDLLVFKAPCNNQSSLLDILRKDLIKAFMQQANQSSSIESVETAKKSEQFKLDRDAILLILYGSDIDLKTYKETFWELILDGLCMVDRKVKLNSTLLSDIDYDDRDEILGEYTANFILPSWTKRQLKQ